MSPVRIRRRYKLWNMTEAYVITCMLHQRFEESRNAKLKPLLTSYAQPASPSTVPPSLSYHAHSIPNSSNESETIFSVVPRFSLEYGSHLGSKNFAVLSCQKAKFTPIHAWLGSRLVVSPIHRWVGFKHLRPYPLPLPIGKKGNPECICSAQECKVCRNASCILSSLKTIS